MNMPLSFSSLMAQADEHHAKYKAEADARDAEAYGPGGMMRTMYRLPEQRLPPQWDAFFQALQNNGVTKMRSEPNHYNIGYKGMTGTNQLGSIGTAPAQEGRLSEGTRLPEGTMGSPVSLNGISAAVGGGKRKR